MEETAGSEKLSVQRLRAGSGQRSDLARSVVSDCSGRGRDRAIANTASGARHGVGPIAEISRAGVGSRRLQRENRDGGHPALDRSGSNHPWVLKVRSERC